MSLRPIWSRELTHIVEAGGYLAVWLDHVTPLEGMLAVFGSYGALYVLLPYGLWLAPTGLRRLFFAAVPAVVAFVYVATPERAIWNLYFLVVPVAALVLAFLPGVWASAFVASYGMANLRLGGQIPDVPASRYAMAVALVLAVAALVTALRHTRGPDPVEPEFA